MQNNIESEKPHDACGIVGIFDRGNANTAQLTYYGLMALQHRGQESAGIAINNDRAITCYKDMGLVQEVFDDKILSLLRGDACIGHVRYSKSSENFVINAQPIVAKYKKGKMAVCLNGAITNAAAIRDELEDTGTIFTTTTDCEVVAALIARRRKNTIVDSLITCMGEFEGAFAIGIMTQDRLIGMRDKYGIRPLSIGKLGDGYAIASESVAFDVMGATLIREIEPGEIVIIDDEGLKSYKTHTGEPKSLCSFEYIYFARPDTNMSGKSVYKVRESAGRQLAMRYPVEADCVIGVPDSGTAAAIGFAAQSGIPYCMGLIKNKYIGRTFIQPTQELRELGVKLKLNPMKDMIDGKRIVLIDDSIVRGTTSKQIVESLRQAGAKEVHMRISSPEVVNVCHFGIDITNVDDLISTHHTSDEICKMIGADSLGFLGIDGLKTALGDEGYCCGCFSGEWPGIH